MTTTMKMNCILTFDVPDASGNTQNFFDIEILVGKQDNCWQALLDKELFCLIPALCASAGRDVRSLSKLSTAANWNVFKHCTGKEGLVGHNGKWFFGHGRDDLDAWEQRLMQEYGFGADVDWSWMHEKDPMKAWTEKMLERLGGSI